MNRSSHAAGARGLSRALGVLEVGLVTVSAVAMAAIMLVVSLDATLRYVMSSPLSWSYELIGLYLMVAVFFWRCRTRSPTTVTSRWTFSSG